MGVLEVFISVAISVAVIFLFRALDRDNNNMGKITRYVNKRMDDFDDYFKGQHDKLNGLSADLDTHQTTAIAAVKRLEQQVEDFRKISSGFEKQFSAVDAIGQKINAYSKVINELMDMTTRVEENLENIRKESAVIDDMTDTIASQKKAVDAIEKKIPQINTAFTERNEEELKKIATALLNQYNARAEQIDRSTAAAAERSEKTLAKLEADIKKAYDEAATRAANLEDTAFKQLTKELEAQMNTKIADLTAHLRTETDGIKKQFTDSLVQAKKTAAELNAEVNGNGKTLENLRTTLEKQMGDLQTRYTTLYEKAVSDADQKETAAYNRFKEISYKHLDDYKAQVEGKINALHGDVDGKVTTLQESMRAAEAAKSELQSFQQKADEQIAAISQKLAQLTQKLSAVYDTKQTELLSLVDSQLAEYRKNLEYRFGKLEQIGTDVDALEKNLRQTLENTQSRVLGDFTAFTSAQERRQEDFARTVKSSNDDLSAQIALLEKNLDDIKATASDNVSATLKDFEEKFGSDLRQRSDKIDDDLNAWKVDLDSKLSALTNDYETRRATLEANYTDELKNRLTELETKNREQAERYEADLSKSLDDIQQRVTGVEQSIRTFTDKALADLQAATDSSNGIIKTNLDTYSQRIDDLIEKAQKDTQEKLAAIEESVQARQDTSKSNIDAMVTDFQSWRNQLKVQFDQTKDLFTKQITSLHAASNQKIEEIRSAFDHDLEEFKTNAQVKQEAIAGDVDGLQQKITDALQDYQTRSDKILADQQKMYEDMLQETQRRVREQNADTDKTMRELRTQIQNITETTDAREVEMTTRMQTDANDLQLRFDDISRQVKAFSDQMAVFKTADQLKLQLDSQINDLRGEIAKIDNYQTTVQSLQARFSQIQNLNDDVSNKLNRFAEEKNHIDSMERDFERLLELSGTMDAKIRELTTTSDDLQSIQTEVRKFQNTLGDISSRYDRLEKKQDDIQQVASDVDKAFENLKSLEDRLSSVTRQSATLPDAIRDVQHSIETLMANSGRINDAVDKITSLQTLLDETEQRVQQITSAREGIGRAETRLQNLDKEIDSKMDLLLRATKADMEKNPGQISDRMTPQDRETIVQLKRTGWTVDEIARRMKRSVGEIELVLEMGTNG